MVGQPRAAIGFGLAGGTVNVMSSLMALPSLQPFRAVEFWALFIGLASGIALLAGVAVLAVLPHHAFAIGLTMMTFSLLGLFGNFGFLCFGPTLGILAAFCAITWPVSEGPEGSAAALALTMASAFFIALGVALGALGPYPFQQSPDLELAIGIAALVLVSVGGVMLYEHPRNSPVWGSIVVVASTVSLFGAHRGFLLGGVIGIVAGMIGWIEGDRAARRWSMWHGNT